MTDDDLGPALGSVLAAPPLRAAPGAGPTLRARARRDRARHALLGVVAAVVVVGLVAGAVRWAPEPAPTAAEPSGRVRLAVPLVVQLSPRGMPACVPEPDLLCGGVPLLRADELLDVRATGGALRAVLTPEDSTTLVAAGRAGTVAVTVSAARGRELPGTADTTALPVVLTVPGGGDLAAALAPYRPRGEYGPGPLVVPLEVRPVRSRADGACQLVRGGAAPGVLVTNWLGQCLLAGPPALRIRSADLSVRGTDAVALEVDPVPAERAALRAWAAANLGEPVALVAGGRVLAVVEPVSTQETFSLLGPDRAAVDALAARLRP